jgi:hypothetical protein
VDTVLNPTGKRVVLLRGAPGLGKSTGLVAVAKRLLHERPVARVLLVAPGALREHFSRMLQNAGTPSVVADRYWFREMVDTAREDEIWPDGVVTILSLDFAKQPDILESLVKVRWDLVIADEAHSFKGARESTLLRVGASAERVVLASSGSFDGGGSAPFPSTDTSVVEWRRDRIVDHEGKPLFRASRTTLHEVPFALTPSELGLRETVRRLCNVLEGSVEGEVVSTRPVLWSLESSPAALESVLRKVAERLGTSARVEPSADVVEEEIGDDKDKLRIRYSDEASRIAGQALQQIEEISFDSKLDAFAKVLGDIMEVRTPHGRVCVVTQYVSSLFYLAAEIENRKTNYSLLHGATTVEERQRILANPDGLLLATTAATTPDPGLAEITDVILYDVPANTARLRQVLDCFDQIGRLGELRVCVLSPCNDGEGTISESIRALRDMIALQGRVPSTN